MPRTFEANNLVQLPVLDAQAAQAIGAAVLAAAANKTLPGPIAEAVAQVKAAVDTLQAASVNRLPIAEFEQGFALVAGGEAGKVILDW